ncbi:MAG: peptidoglycan DD-metalloendopeptidase family protein [Candidatus Eremiobacteraeota bacterium]|nr:peptidoglycan DD-metalloendopeptidase family protein [Candidatus Eremiobacteraeota bacterium]MBV9973351.1 peptidoglycan DD-metalloendopeptidase family protein [Candidatus Eremiobacteraeota bacterium]
MPARRRRGCRIVVALGIAFLLSAHQTDASRLTERIREEQLRVEQHHQQLQQRRAQLHVAQMRESDLSRQLAETNHAIGSVNVRLDELDGEVHINQRRLAWNQVQLAAAQETLRRHNDAYRKRLVQIYEHSDVGYLSVLLGATSFAEFVERLHDLQLLVKADQKAIAERKAAETTVRQVQSQLEGTQLQLEGLAQQQQQARNQLQGLATEREQLVAVASAQRRQVAAEVEQLEELSAAEEASLESLIAQRQAELEAERLAAERARRAGQPAPPGPATASSGFFQWPVHGPITSPFGWRIHPISGVRRFHEGIDIAASSGTPIAAAEAGRVIIAGWYGGYGNYISIDHGGGVSTGYGHCSAIYVSVGQDVSRGQAIGAVGSTGFSTGPHLHFEVRINGKPVDPLSRLR